MSALRCRSWREALLAVVLATAGLSPWPVLAQAIDVITAPGAVTGSLDRGRLRAIFAMRQREWPDGQPIRVFVLPDADPVHDQFARERLGTYPYVLRDAWDRMVFTGTGLAPAIVHSQDEMEQLVKSTPGAIGYVRRTRSSGLTPPGPGPDRPGRAAP